MSDDCPYGQCDHSFGAHECGLCQVNTGTIGKPEFCPCKYEDDDDA